MTYICLQGEEPSEFDIFQGLPETIGLVFFLYHNDAG